MFIMTNRIYGSKNGDLKVLAEEDMCWIREYGFAKNEEVKLIEQGLLIVYESLRTVNKDDEVNSIRTRYWN